MKVGELKKRCSEEGGSKTGTKATLITALVHNFIGNKPTPVKEQPTPPTGEDITAFYTDTTPCQTQVDAAIKLNANKPQERNPEAPLWIGTYLFNDRVRACPRSMFLLGQRKRVFKNSKEDVAVVARVWLHEANLGTPLGELSMENLLEKKRADWLESYGKRVQPADHKNQRARQQKQFGYLQCMGKG